MENGDAPQAQPQPAAADMQQQIQYLQNQLQAQQQLFLQQQQYLVFQQQHAAQQQQQGRRAEPHKVKLPPLWTTQAQTRSWFQLAESQFDIYAVENPRLRFDLVLAAMSDEARLHAKAIVDAPGLFRDPYLALRTRILEVYQPSVWQMAAEFLQGKELGDMRPSDMMDEMLALLPQDLSLLVKASFLGRLPADMRDHVQEGAEHLSYQQLAARADTIWNARRANRPAAVTAAVTEAATTSGTSPQVDPAELEQILAAVRFVRQQPKSSNYKRPAHHGGNGGGGGQGPDDERKKGWCRRHRRYGEKAFQCDAPATCQYTKN